MLRGRTFAPALALLAVLGLAACTPDTIAATPTPTVLTEDEAYAQAEAAVRAYVAALNSVDVADPQTFETVFALTTGPLNSFDRKQFSTWHAEGWVESGDTVLQRLDRSQILEDGTVAQFSVCLDVSAVRLVDSNGVSQVSPDRPDVQPVYVEAMRGGNGLWLVQNLFGRGDGEPC